MHTTGGTSVQIASFDADDNLVINWEALEGLLEGTNKRIVILSIGGEFRKGKSFLLNYMLRYLCSDREEGWLGEPNTPLEGFHWRAGTDRQTMGIVAWSNLLNIDDNTVLLLLDTQGLFDGQTSSKQESKIFALSMLLSSIQILNVSNQLNETILQSLQMFVNCGRQSNDSGEFFQHLHFLVRDWLNPQTHAYGHEGGQAYLEAYLDNLQLREEITSCFDAVSCYLLPFPGGCVTEGDAFDGRISSLDERFSNQLKHYISWLLSADRLPTKKINGRIVNGGEILEATKVYVDSLQTTNDIHYLTLLEAQSRLRCIKAARQALEDYKTVMNKDLNQLISDGLISRNDLLKKHELQKKNVISVYDNINRNTNATEIREQLISDIEKAFQDILSMYMDPNQLFLDGFISRNGLLKKHESQKKIVLRDFDYINRNTNATDIREKLISDIEKAFKDIFKMYTDSYEMMKLRFEGFNRCLEDLKNRFKAKRHEIQTASTAIKATKTTGTAVGVVGTIGSIIGLIGAPLTGGLSLAATAAIVGTGVAGAVTSTAAEIVNGEKTKNFVSEIRQLQTDLKRQLEVIGGFLADYGIDFFGSCEEDSTSEPGVNAGLESAIEVGVTKVVHAPVLAGLKVAARTQRAIGKAMKAGQASKAAFQAANATRRAFKLATKALVGLDVIFTCMDIGSLVDELKSDNPYVQEIDLIVDSITDIQKYLQIENME